MIPRRERLLIELDSEIADLESEIAKLRAARKILAETPEAASVGGAIFYQSDEATRSELAVLLGRRGGAKGGHARARKLTKERRVEIAKKAAEARWRK